MQSFSIADARSQFPKIIHKVEKGDVAQLTRRGEPVAVLLSLKEYNALLSQSKGSLLQALKAYKVLKHKAGEDLSNKEVDSWRSEEIGRKLPWE